MSITLKPMQVLVLWALIAKGGKALQKNIKPQITKPLRNSLEQAGLVESGKNRKRAIIIEVTDKGWAWAAENLDAELPTRSTAAGPIMQAFLTQLKIFLKSRNIAFAEIFMVEDDSARDVPSEIRLAYLEISGGEFNKRVHLHQLRQQLSDIEPQILNKNILEMLEAKKLHLMELDNRREITDADQKAAIMIGHEPVHVMYIGE